MWVAVLVVLLYQGSRFPGSVRSLGITPLVQRSGILWIKFLHTALGVRQVLLLHRVSLCSCSLLGLWVFFGIGVGSGLSHHLPQHLIMWFCQAWALVALARINLHPSPGKVRLCPIWLILLLLVSVRAQPDSSPHRTLSSDWALCVTWFLMMAESVLLGWTGAKCFSFNSFVPSASMSRVIIPGNSLFRLLTTSTRLTMTRNAVWALSNLCRGKSPPPEFEKVRRNALLAARWWGDTQLRSLSGLFWAVEERAQGEVFAAEVDLDV